VSGKILVGTASWSDPGFVERWYPKKLPAGDRLPWYAQHFDLVEVNSTFYSRAGTENGGALVRCDRRMTSRRRKIAPAVFISLNTGKAVASGFTKPRGDGREGEGQTNARLAGGAAESCSARDRNLSQRRKNGCPASAPFASVFGTRKHELNELEAAHRDAEWVRGGD